MPSEKRARQRAQRAQKQAVVQRQRKRRRNLRRTLTFGGIAAAIVLIVVLIQVSGSSKPKSSASSGSRHGTSTTTTTFPPPTTQPLTTTAVVPKCPPPTGSKTRVVLFTHAPPNCISPTSIWDATFTTSVGTFVVRMDASKSFAAVNNFVFLALYQYYNGTFFHRIIKGFVDQGGDPAGTGAGGAGTGTGVLAKYGYPGYEFTGNTPPASCKSSGTCYATGDIATANRGSPSTDGGQFFLIVPGGGAQLNPPVYADFGHVISGMSVVEKINSYGSPATSSAGTPTKKIYLLKVTVKQVKS